jgi:Uma2 family endonuclease
MSTARPWSLLKIKYAEAAEAYLRSLPPRHFLESVRQATQRKITVESFDLVHAQDPTVWCYNELLIQYPFGPHQLPRQVVPDNFIARHDGPLKVEGHFDVLFQPVGPFWVLEYISKGSKRKDYEDNFRKYEKRLKVPYLLHFYPEAQELTLYRHNGKKYVTVQPNEHGRYPVPELHLELALLDGWVRFWYKGKLLPLPADLQRELDEVKRQLAKEKRRADEATRRADEQARQADEQAQRAEVQARRADEQTQRAEEQARRADEADQARQAAERKAAELQAELDRLKGQKKKS